MKSAIIFIISGVITFFLWSETVNSFAEANMYIFVDGPLMWVILIGTFICFLLIYFLLHKIFGIDESE